MRLVAVPASQRVVHRQRRRIRGWVVLSLVLFLTAGTIMYLRPLPSATVHLSLPDAPAAAQPSLVWPAVGKAALSAEGYSFIASPSLSTETPTASIAKVITVLVVLQKYPLKSGATGPVLTMTADDVARMNKEIARNGTHLKIVEGEKLTQYQAMQAILLPSANNISDTLAIWAFGSMEAYLTYANAYLEAHGMSQTHVEGDASGFDPRTVSSTTDFITLAKLALQEPVLMEIAGQESATFQTAGTMRNHNSKVSGGFITGLKTGRNDGNSGSLLFTAKVGEGDDAVQLTGIVADAGTLRAALNGAEALAESAADDFPKTVLARKGQIVGTVRTAWGTAAPIVAANDAALRHWSGSKLYQTLEKNSVSGTEKAVAATLQLKADGRKSSTDLVISQPAAAPTIWWRLTHWR